jgi:hypothetical protein
MVSGGLHEFPSNLSCPKLPPFQGLKNMLAGIRSTGAKPLVDILAWQYGVSVTR